MHMGNIPFILLKGLMMKTELTCPKCGAIVEKYLNPKPTVDIVIHDRERGLVLVDRKNPPYGNALPKRCTCLCWDRFPSCRAFARMVTTVRPKY